VKIDRLTIRGPAEQAAELIGLCCHENWAVSGITYETINSVQWVVFNAEKEIPRGN
jgi:hypothetical protein